MTSVYTNDVTSLRSISGEPTYLFTSGNHHWNHAYLTVHDRANLVFAVKACSEVRLMLGENFVSKIPKTYTYDDVTIIH